MTRKPEVRHYELGSMVSVDQLNGRVRVIVWPPEDRIDNRARKRHISTSGPQDTPSPTVAAPSDG